MSPPDFPVSPGKNADLKARMAKLGVAEGDLDEQFIRGSGAGGQKINKTSSCVLITHAPSGIQVRCQTSRSQALNRFVARRMIVEELEKRIEGRKSAVVQKREKLRRQKKRRTRRGKEKMLVAKKKRSENIKNRSVDD